MSLKDLKEFDWKNFLLMKGERIGLAICGLITVVLIGMSLFWPGHGFFTGSGVANAEELNQRIRAVENDLTNNRPSDQENPPPATSTVVSLAKNNIAFTERSKYQLPELFSPSTVEETRRRVPELLLPDEGRVEVVMAQLKRYIFNKDFTRVMVLKTKEGKTPQRGDSRNKDAKRFRNSFANMPGRPGGFNPGMVAPGSAGAGANQRMNARLAVPGMSLGVVSDNSNKPEMDAEFVPLEKVGDENAHLAETVLPLRMAIISASFPYRAQIDEFMRKLHIADPSEVLAEVGYGPDGEAKLPAFRFLGVRAQRRVVDSEGKPVSPKLGGEWQTLDLEKSYRPFIVLAGKRFDPEDEKLTAISFPGLVMPKLLQFRENQYPAVETRLPNLQNTLAAIEDKEPDQVVVPKRFDIGQFDIFTGGDKTNTVPAGGMGGNRTAQPANPTNLPTPAGTKPKPAAGKPPVVGGPTGVAGAPPASATRDGAVPDHCLVRLIDVTIEPGVTYQYRIQVRMANPNYKRPEIVAAPNYANDLELANERWFEIADKVVVPPELLFYAVDQKEIDGPNYKGPFARAIVEKDRQVPMQIHKWLENAAVTGDPRPIGEWVVAERLLVYRGEYISRKLRCEIPEWKNTREEFILAAESSGNARRKESGITVDFSQPGNDAILVDFEGGDLNNDRVTQLADGKSETAKVKDKSAVETLILSPEGKLLARDFVADASDKERIGRLKAYRDRITDVKEGRGPGDKKGPAASPFAKP